MISKPAKSRLIQNFVPAYAKVNKYPKRSVHVGRSVYSNFTFIPQNPRILFLSISRAGSR